MTNEIKEILDEMKEVALYSTGSNLVRELDSKDCNLLLDYITNLQNEIFDLKDTIQNKNDCIGAYDEIIKDRDERIDKAIKYINEITYCEFDNSYMKYVNDLTPEYIIKILKGDE